MISSSPTKFELLQIVDIVLLATSFVLLIMVSFLFKPKDTRIRVRSTFNDALSSWKRRS